MIPLSAPLRAGALASVVLPVVAFNWLFLPNGGDAGLAILAWLGPTDLAVLVRVRLARRRRERRHLGST